MIKYLRYHWFSCLALTAFAVAFGAAVLIPLGSVLSGALSGHDLMVAMFDPIVLAIVKATLKQAATSTTLAIFLGYPLGLWFSSLLQGRSLVLSQRILALPFGVPSIVAVTAWIALFGQTGILARYGLKIDILYSWTMVVFVHAFFNIPYIALIVSEARDQIPTTQIDALHALGATRWQVFRFLIAPRTLPALRVATLQVFNLCTMSFAIVLILGGGPPVATLETAIYERLRFGVLDMTGALACAIWQLMINLIPAFALVRHLQTKHQQMRTPPSVRTQAWSWRPLLGVVICLAFVMPYFFFLDGLTALSQLETIFVRDLAMSLWVSLRLAFMTSFFSLGFAALAAINLHAFRRHKGMAQSLLYLASLPAGVSALVLGVGVWEAYGRWIDPFAGNLILIAAIQGILTCPLVFRILLVNLASFQERSIQSLQCLGASYAQALYYVEWPRWRRPLLTAWSMSMGASLAEISVVTLFSGDHGLPLPVAIQQLLGQYRFAEAQWATALLFAAAMATMVLSSRFSLGGTSRE